MTDTPNTDVLSGARALVQEMLDNLKHCSLDSGSCHCGDRMDRHSDPMSCGHSPVDMGWSVADAWVKKAEAFLSADTQPAGNAGFDHLTRAKARADKRAASGEVSVEGSIYEGMEACLVQHGHTIAHVPRYADAVDLAARLTTQPAINDAVPAGEPVAWLHTVHMEQEQKSQRLTFEDGNPWGVPGQDYSAEYPVTSQPLYATATKVAVNAAVPAGERIETWRKASVSLGGWLSAALEDPSVCDAMKADINAWFSAGEPFGAMLATATKVASDTQAEIERLRGLLVDPGSPPWEDARAVLVAELRKSGFNGAAKQVAEGEGCNIPSHVALNLIAHAARAKVASDTAKRCPTCGDTSPLDECPDCGAYPTRKVASDTGAGLREAVIAAISKADAAFGYSYRMTKMDDTGEEHTLFMDGFEPAIFEDREDGYPVIEQRRNALRAGAILAALSTDATLSVRSNGEVKFKLGDRVKKVSGSAWHGIVVGSYSTALTPEGYAVESEREPGSVQIYPARALNTNREDAQS